MAAPTDFLNITDLPEADDLTDLFLAAELPDPSEQTKKIPVSMLNDMALKISNKGDSGIAGGKIWPVEDRPAKVGDSGLLSVVAISNGERIYKTSETVSGSITALDFDSGVATIGGTDVVLSLTMTGAIYSPSVNTTLRGPCEINGKIKPESGVVVTLASDCIVRSSSDWKDTSAGGSFKYQSGCLEFSIPGKVSSPTGGFIYHIGYPGNSIDESSGTSFVFGGTQSLPHTLGPQCQLSGILNGYDNHIIANAISSLICGGAHNYIKDGGNHGTVVGGAFNDVFAPFSFIGGGELNKNMATWSFIGGGQKNETGEDGQTPIDVRSSFVGGGDSNKATRLLSGVMCGAQNQATNEYAVVGGGRNNTSSGVDSSIIGGMNNTSSGEGSTSGGVSCQAKGLASTTLGSSCTAGNNYSFSVGFFNDALATSSVATGQYTVATLKSQRAHGNGAFPVKGSSQISDLVASALTIGSQTKSLDLGAAGVDPILIPSNTSWVFKISLIARNIDSNDQNGAWLIQGAIKKDETAATCALIGTPIKTDINVPTGWNNGLTPSVAADTSNGSMKITVSTTPAVTESIRWVARIELAEVAG